MGANYTPRFAEITRLQSQVSQSNKWSLSDLRQLYYGGNGKMLSQNDAIRSFLQSQLSITTPQSINDLWRLFFAAKGAPNMVSLGDMADYFFNNIGFAPAVTTLVNETMASSPTTGTADNNNSAGWNAGGYYLLTNGGNQYADLYYTGNLGANFTMTVDQLITSTSGADASWFFWGWNARPHTEGDSTNAGYLLERNDFDGHIRLRWAGTEIAVASWTKDTSFDTLKIVATGNEFKVYNNGTLQFDFTDSTRTLPGTTYGWGARCGGSGNTHEIKNLLLTQP